MNRHFEDTRYYLKRAGETAKRGIAEELEPLEARVRKLTGKEGEPDPERRDELRAELADLQERAEGEAKKAIGTARERLQTVRRASSG
ncbi:MULTISPECIES: DUF7553 family protein [Salinibaculum]|uniref:DUF7553 family protein n=1 Tax=Salinibaculum TaxID=2732368 RepID=UPI0030D202CF